MKNRLEPFFRHGTEEERIEVSAHEVLKVIAEGRDIDVEHSVINGHLEIEQIADQLERDENNRPILMGAISIERSEIRGGIDFSESFLSGRVCFNHTNIHKFAFFNNTTFGGNTSFCNTIFYGKVMFNLATFDKTPLFLSARFDDDFEQDRFVDGFGDFSIFNRTEFESVDFHNGVNFNFAIFQTYVSFKATIFDGWSEFAHVTFEKGVFFTNATFNIGVHFLGCIANSTSFRSVCIIENTVYRRVIHPIVRRILWFLTAGKRSLRKKPITNILSFDANRMVVGISNPYLKRYIDDEQWIESWRKKGKFHGFLFYVWELTSHCGRSIGLWAFWSLLIAIIFGLLHRGHIDIRSVSNWYTPFYFSVVTFTTLGFGDVTPLDWVGQLWITLEVILGYIMLGGLISIFANKFARRS